MLPHQNKSIRSGRKLYQGYEDLRHTSGYGSREPSYDLVPLVEFVHTASLIHDDIEDGSEIRRGEPAAYIAYGTDFAINSGSWLYFAAAECIQNSELSSEEKNILYGIFFTELRRLHAGQAMDIYWHKSKVYPSLKNRNER